MRIHQPSLILLCLFIFASSYSEAQERQIRVFVALHNNKSPGAAKVDPKKGNGDEPAQNLYWGDSDGLSAYFKKSSKWKLIKTETKPSEIILERLTFQHNTFKDVTLIAEAYRGSEMRQCLLDFFNTVHATEWQGSIERSQAAAPKSVKVEMIAFIGNNEIGQHLLPYFPFRLKESRDAIFLTNFYNEFFSVRPRLMNPVLTTQAQMYPGSFLLHDALEGWVRNESVAEIRERAARSYARNQKVPIEDGRAIFDDSNDSYLSGKKE